MNTPVLLAERIAASAAIGLLIGLEREWAHKEAGVRSFAIAALLGTLSWLAAPGIAYAEVGIVLVILLMVNLYAILKDHPLEITTSLALALTNVLGILVGMDAFFLAFTTAIVVTALLSWKTELISFTSKLTSQEIRGTLLLGFIAAVIYPLLPDNYVDPWKIINPRGIWLTVVIVSSLNFVNYVLLRQLGMRGMRYSAILGGLVNSAATAAILGDELKQDPDFAIQVPSDFLLADIAMIFRNAGLVILFSWTAGLQTTMDIAIILGPMLLIAAIISLIVFLQTWRTQQPSKPPALTSPLALRSVIRFGLLFLSLTLLSGAMQRFFGAIGFLVIAIVGALASAAASAVLVGNHIESHQITASMAVIAIYLASVVGLLENVVIFWSVTRQRPISIRLALYTLPVILAGGLAIIGAIVFGWF